MKRTSPLERARTPGWGSYRKNVYSWFS